MRRIALVLPCLSLWLSACTCPFAHHEGVQQPQMAPAKGTYEVPAAKVGTMPSETWSATTVEAAVNKAPRPGTIRTISGEIIDVSCYLQLGKHGEKHRDCGMKCAKNGNPIGLLAADGTVYLLMAEEHHPRRDGKTESLQEALIAHMAQVVTVTGAATELNGAQALFVSGFAK